MSFFPDLFPKAGTDASTPTIRPKYLLFKTKQFAAAKDRFLLTNGSVTIEQKPDGADMPWAEDYAILPWVTDTQQILSSSSNVTQSAGGYVNQKLMSGGGFVTGDWVIAGEISPIPFSDEHVASMAKGSAGRADYTQTPIMFQIIQNAINLIDSAEADVDNQLMLYSLQEGEYWYVQPLTRQFFRKKPDRVGWRYEFAFRLLARAMPPKLDIIYAKVTEKKSWYEKMSDGISTGLKYSQAAINWCSTVASRTGQLVEPLLGGIETVSNQWTDISNLITSILSTPEALTLRASGWVENFISGYDAIESAGRDMVSFFENYTDYWDFTADTGSDDVETGDTRPSQDSMDATLLLEYTRGIGAAINDTIVGIRMALSETLSGRTARVINAGDSLESIALTVYGDKAYAKQLADWNNLIPPYISNSGIPGTLRPGDSLYIPYTITGSTGTLAPLEGVFAGDTSEQLYGRGLKLITTPGHPLEGDIKIANDRLGTDEIFGAECAKQGLWVRMLTEYGKDANFTTLGLPGSIGQITDVSAQAMANAAISWQIQSDNRIEKIDSLDVTASGAELTIDTTCKLISTDKSIGLGVEL